MVSHDKVKVAFDWERSHELIGRETNDLVYERLAFGVLEELKRRNRRMPSGNRKNKHHQWFTAELSTES
ncbi:MAG: hypothetical protein F4Z52_07945 [Gammaproteobacteria bacterium]|nr:hypothetical protein [Gammaproteobacteria bacterium]